MALIKTSGQIISMRGRFGGVYFKKDGTGQHIQTMPRSIRKASMESPIILPSSPGSRAAMINGMSSAAFVWLMMLIISGGYAILQDWGVFSDDWMYDTGKPQNPKKLCGYLWFMHFNIGRCAKLLPAWLRPPKSPTNLPDGTTRCEWQDMNALNFYVEGTYNGKTLYKSQDGKWSCWWLDPSWIISNAPGQSETPPYWFNLSGNEFGQYQPVVPVFKTTWLYE